MKQTVSIIGGGSLGEAFVRLLHEKYKLTVADSSEWTTARLQNEYPDVTFRLTDYADVDNFDYDYVIFTAAYKHLPLGETNPESFIDNNITKAQKFMKGAAKAGTKLCFISTDKAVEPCSLYGYTKAIGEHLARHYGFSVARLGNILNSSGSVIPVWEDCIAKGLPVKVTDERMARYFIEDMDAVNQIWYEFIQGKKLIIPKCEEIRIMDLLSKVLEKHGFEKASDYAPGVEITGIRPNEKLSEKLTWDSESEAL